jgi:AcrR family transcriptional regulator
MTDDDTAPPAGPRRRDAAATREALLTATRELIAERGIAGISTRDIAARAGANQALVYRYFGSKDALLLKTVEDAWPETDRDIADVPLPELPHVLLRRAVEVAPDTGRRVSSLASLVTGSDDDIARGIIAERIHAGYTTQLAGRLGGADAALRAELLAALITGIAVLREKIGTEALVDADLDALGAHVDRMAAALFAADAD